MDAMDSATLLGIVAKVVERDVSLLDFGTTLVDIEWDSLSQLGFVAELDSNFRLQVDTEILQKATTIGDLIEAVIRG